MRHSGFGLRHSVLVLLAVAWVLALPGCGYRSTETCPEQYQSVSVPIFENRTFYKGVEFDLAEALTKQLTARTAYRLASPGAADTVLEGTITSIQQVTLSRTEGAGLPEQMEVVVTIDFTWKDLNTGEPIMDRRGFSSLGRYIPDRVVGEGFAVAQHDAADQLARDIVDQMRGDW